jgi:RimJ/RimL family protein N-acetyltransferase
MTPADFPGIETERLLLRRFRPDDLAPFLAYRNDSEVARYDGLTGLTEARARAYIAEQMATPAGVPGLWLQIAVERRSEGLIGDCGFFIDDRLPGTAEIGYRLRRDRWGQGYASEAVGAVLDWAFGALGLHRAVALIDTRNVRSMRLVERLGFRREGTFLESYAEPDGWSDEAAYAILEREWRQRRVSQRSPPSIPGGRHEPDAPRP